MLFVLRHGHTGTEQIPIPIHIINTIHGWPELVGLDCGIREYR